MDYTLGNWTHTVLNTASALIDSADSDGRRVDVIAEIREVEKGLAKLRQDTAAEIETLTRGTDWMIERTDRATRSFNTPRLLRRAAARMEGDMFGALESLMDGAAVDLGWKFTNLKRWARNHDMSLTVAQHQIGYHADDIDQVDVGEEWAEGYPAYTRISSDKGR